MRKTRLTSVGTVTKIAVLGCLSLAAGYGAHCYLDNAWKACLEQDQNHDKRDDKASYKECSAFDRFVFIPFGDFVDTADTVIEKYHDHMAAIATVFIALFTIALWGATVSLWNATIRLAEGAERASERQLRPWLTMSVALDSDIVFNDVPAGSAACNSTSQ